MVSPGSQKQSLIVKNNYIYDIISRYLKLQQLGKERKNLHRRTPWYGWISHLPQIG